MEENKSALEILSDKSTGKTALRKSRRRWEDNIRMDPKEIGVNTSNWVYSAQDKDYQRALMKQELNLRVPLSQLQDLIKLSNPLETNFRSNFCLTARSLRHVLYGTTSRLKPLQ